MRNLKKICPWDGKIILPFRNQNLHSLNQQEVEQKRLQTRSLHHISDPSSQRLVKRLQLTMAVSAGPRYTHSSGKETTNRLRFSCSVCDAVKNMQYTVINLNIKGLHSLTHEMRDILMKEKKKKKKEEEISAP